jgi:conjugal transfer pilus assembly protein TraD
VTPKPPPARRPLLWGVLAFTALVTMPLPAAAAVLAVGTGVRFAVRLAQRARAAQAERVAAGDPAATRLGTDPAGRSVSIPDRALAAHGLILGATGAGKSTTLLSLLGTQIARGRPVVAIDLKGSPTFAQDLAAKAAAAGRPFKLWTIDGNSYWNPLASGNATELKDKLIATERFTEPHYQRAAERYVQLALQVMQEAAPERPITLAGVVSMLEPARLAAATRKLPRERAESVRAYVSNLTPDQISAVRGLASRLAILTESHTGRYLEAPPPGDWPQTVDVRQALESDEVVLFSLNSSSYGQLAGQLGTLAVQDLVTAAGNRLQTAGARGVAPRQAIVAIDEFSALGSDNVIALLARGREAGVGVLLATQELADLDRAARGLRDQVLGNTSLKIAHRQDVPESATAVARLAGQVKAWDRSYHQQAGALGGRVMRTTTRLVDRDAIDQEQIRSLRTGEALVIIKSPESSARITRVQPPDRSAPER